MKLFKDFFIPKYSGFTLIEIMVSIFILSLGIVAVLMLFPSSFNIVSFSKSSTVASRLAEEKIEEIISLPYDSINIGEESELSFFDEFERTVKVYYVDPVADFKEVFLDSGMKKIDIEVFWQSKMGIGRRSIKITTLLSNR